MVRAPILRAPSLTGNQFIATGNVSVNRAYLNFRLIFRASDHSLPAENEGKKGEELAELS